MRYYVHIWNTKFNKVNVMLSQFAPEGSTGSFDTESEAKEASKKLNQWLKDTKRRHQEARIEIIEEVSQP